MANEKFLKARFQQKSDTSEHWALASNFIPLDGEIIIYSDLKKFKIGDGKTNVNNLDFSLEVDETLSVSGASADAKIVGDQLSYLNQKIDNMNNYQSGITSIDDGSGNITLQAMYIPLSSSDDNQGNVTISM